MDYRNREYYLVDISWRTYDMRMNLFKLAAPSLKIHKPYNHFKYNKDRYGYDGSSKNTSIVKNRCWQMMISCKKEDAIILEWELYKAKLRDKQINNDVFSSDFIKLNKELCGQ